MRWPALFPLLTLAAAAPADERRFLITNFERLRVEGPIEVEVVAGSPGATATGDRRALEALTVRVDSGTMVVRPGSEGTGVPRVRVSVPALRGVIVNGAGQVRIAEARGNRVDLALSGAGTLEVANVAATDLIVTSTGGGTLTLAGKAERARVRSYGTGSIDGARLTAGEATLISESSGNLTLGARYLARATALGTGTVRVLGRPECRVNGPGPVECGAAGAGE
jgi:hypothetical protein